jgi:hypothetical protein
MRNSYWHERRKHSPEPFLSVGRFEWGRSEGGNFSSRFFDDLILLNYFSITAN